MDTKLDGMISFSLEAAAKRLLPGKIFQILCTLQIVFSSRIWYDNRIICKELNYTMKSAVRLICLFLSCCMLLSILPVAAYMEETDGICEICGQSPCACAPEEGPDLCPKCGEDPCTCSGESGSDPLCPDCGKDPCTCQKDEPALCLDCTQAECICGKTEDTCLGADICTEGIHDPSCPLYVAPTCTQDESCTLTENHLEGCPKIQSTPAPVSDGDTGLKVQMFMGGPNAEAPKDVNRAQTLVNEVGYGFNLAITIGGNHISFDTLSLSKTGVVSMSSLTDMNGNITGVCFTSTKVGTTEVIYTDPDTKVPETVVTIETIAMRENHPLYPNADDKLEEHRLLWTCLNGGFGTQIDLQSGFTVTTTIGILKTDGLYPIDVSKLYSTTDLIRLGGSGSSCQITLGSEAANGSICYDDESGQTYNMQLIAREILSSNGENAYDIGFDPIPELVLVTEDDVRHTSYTLYPNESINVTFRKGSTGGSIPFTGTVTSGDPETLEVAKTEEGYTLTAKKSGKVTLTGTYGESQTITCQIDIPEVKVGAAKLFNAFGHDPNGNTMRTYLRIYPDESCYAQFCFGTSAKNSTVVTDLHCSDNVTLTAQGDGYFEVSATGNGLIWYTHDGVDYTIPVRYADIDQSNDFGDGNTIEVNGVTYGTAIMTQEKMTFRNYFGSAYSDNEYESGFSEQVVLAAIDKEAGTVSKEAYSCISDVRFEMLACIEEDKDVKCDNVALSPTVSRPKDPASGVLTWGSTVSAGAKQGFRTTIAMSFTLSLPNETPRRITLQCRMGYIKIPDTIVAHANDLDTVGKLNAVLSSRDALIKYLKNPGKGATVDGDPALCYTTSVQIALYLPDVTYDGIVVAQPVPDAYNDPETGFTVADGQLQLYGSGKTTFRGLINRGGVNVVNNISFVADSEKTMTYGGETFTCGILSDYTIQDIDVTYDQDYLNKYCGGSAPSMQASINLVDKQSSRLVGYVDVHMLYNCSFTGFDYGVYSTENGMAGGGGNCTFTDCHTGIYVNAKGDSKDSRNVDYSGHTFRNNVYAIRVKSLTSGIFPYYVRVHDCYFYDNYREFWITPEGDYYCYRNYYSGCWQDKKQCASYVLNKDCKLTFDDWDQEYQTSQATGARPGRAYAESKDAARVISTASRSAPDSYSGFLIYARKDQNNRILKSEGSNLALAEESIDALTQDTDVYIVENDGSEIAVITFQGTED